MDSGCQSGDEVTYGGKDQTGPKFPLGATVYPDGVNFSVYSKMRPAWSCSSLIAASDPKPSNVIGLDPEKKPDHQYWHVFLPGPGTVSYMDIESVGV